MAIQQEIRDLRIDPGCKIMRSPCIFAAFYSSFAALVGLGFVDGRSIRWHLLREPTAPAIWPRHSVPIRCSTFPIRAPSY